MHYLNTILILPCALTQHNQMEQVTLGEVLTLISKDEFRLGYSHQTEQATGYICQPINGKYYCGIFHEGIEQYVKSTDFDAAKEWVHSMVDQFNETA